jgi:hypothetical protein
VIEEWYGRAEGELREELARRLYALAEGVETGHVDVVHVKKATDFANGRTETWQLKLLPAS